LPYEAYGEKFSKATEELAVYDRPLARIIVSLIEFHFNHFRESVSLFPTSRVGSVARRYAVWIGSEHPTLDVAGLFNTVFSRENSVTDCDTEQILRWAALPLRDLFQLVGGIEAFRKRDLAEFDRVKLTILLGEIYAEARNAYPLTSPRDRLIL